MIETTVKSIPCIVVPTYVEPFIPEDRRGHPDRWQPAEGGYAEYEVQDMRGRPAPWLERKIDDAEDRRIQRLILSEL